MQQMSTKLKACSKKRKTTKANRQMGKAKLKSKTKKSANVRTKKRSSRIISSNNSRSKRLRRIYPSTSCTGTVTSLKTRASQTTKLVVTTQSTSAKCWLIAISFFRNLAGVISALCGWQGTIFMILLLRLRCKNPLRITRRRPMTKLRF